MNDGPKTVDPKRSALVVVDVQHDFLPGGALPVEEGDQILEGVARLMDDGPFEVQVATQDWHPPGHSSFASSHDGREPMETVELHGHEQVLWPDHCVEGTEGAELHPALPGERLVAVVRKGTDPESDSYSGFRNNWNADGERPPTGLAGFLRERGVERVWLCGLARDYCVRWSAEDAVDAGFETSLIWDLTRSIEPEKDDELRAALEEKGVRIVDADQVG